MGHNFSRADSERLILFFIFFILRRMWQNKALAHHTSTYFAYASCVDLTQLLSQPNASWRTLVTDWFLVGLLVSRFTDEVPTIRLVGVPYLWEGLLIAGSIFPGAGYLCVARLRSHHVFLSRQEGAIS